MAELILSKGKAVALLDEIDYEWALQFSWYWSRKPPPYTSYAQRAARRHEYPVGTKRPTQLLHRDILARMLGRDLLPGELVDHRDNNGLNNHRSNIRLASHSENMANRRKRTDSKYQYVGVSCDVRYGTWSARIFHDGCDIKLGMFQTEFEAARAYDAAALNLRGEFAKLNFPP